MTKIGEERRGVAPLQVVALPGPVVYHSRDFVVLQTNEVYGGPGLVAKELPKPAANRRNP